MAKERRNLSVERLADLIDASTDSLYKWMGDGKMPAAKIQPFEHACGAHFVTEYLAGGAHRVVVEIPRGRQPGGEDLAELQMVTAAAVSALSQFWARRIEIDEANAQLTLALQALAWHRANAEQAGHPELDLDDDGQDD